MGNTIKVGATTKGTISSGGVSGSYPEIKETLVISFI